MTITAPTATTAPARTVWRKRVRLEQADGYLTVRFRDAVDVELLHVDRGNVGLNVYAEVTPAKDRPVEPTEFYFAVVRTGAPIPTEGRPAYVGTARAVIAPDPADIFGETRREVVHLYRVDALPEVVPAAFTLPDVTQPDPVDLDVFPGSGAGTFPPAGTGTVE